MLANVRKRLGGLMGIAVLGAFAITAGGAFAASDAHAVDYFTGTMYHNGQATTSSGYLVRSENWLERPSGHYKAKFFYPSGTTPPNYIVDKYGSGAQGTVNIYGYSNIAACQNVSGATNINVRCSWYA